MDIVVVVSETISAAMIMRMTTDWLISVHHHLYEKLTPKLGKSRLID